MMEQGPVLVISFNAQQTMVVRNAKGDVVEGDPVSLFLSTSRGHTSVLLFVLQLKFIIKICHFILLKFQILCKCIPYFKSDINYSYF